MKYIYSLANEYEGKTYSALRRGATRLCSADWTFPQLHNELLPVTVKKLKDSIDLLLILGD